MRQYVDLSEKVTATFYDEEYEEWTQQTVTIADVLDSVCDDYTVLPTIEPRKGKWIDEGFYADGHGAHAFKCSECGGHIIEYDVDPFCRWCGAQMER